MLQKRVIMLICGAPRREPTKKLFFDQHILKLPVIVTLKFANGEGIPQFITGEFTAILQH